ncbi:MAG: hypothetical protein ACE5PV_02700 [Candidatus Poribacteria bacterium]
MRSLSLQQQLENELNFYRRKVKGIGSNRMTTPLMLEARDRIEELVKALYGRIKLDRYMEEIEALDSELIAKASEVLRELSTFRPYDDIPLNHWWWRLDETEK